MAMDSVSEENVERLLNDRHNKQGELCTIQSTTIENMWLNELEELKRMIIKKNVTATASANASATVPKTIKIKKVVKKTIAK